MQVIGAGFGRTGTLSTKTALEELGFGPCYHMFEVRKNKTHGKMWAAASRGEPVDWRELFKEYRATVDWPGCTYYKELMVAYPNAKVLLSVRDPEKWYESVLTTIYGPVKSRRDAHEAASALQSTVSSQPDSAPQHSASVCKSRIWDVTFSGKFEDREHTIEVFNRHNEEVKRHVPPDKLLVYEVTDGWEPLCEFLNVEVPEGKPFPRLNDAPAYWDLSSGTHESGAFEGYLRDARYYFEKARTTFKGAFDRHATMEAAVIAALRRKKGSSSGRPKLGNGGSK